MHCRYPDPGSVRITISTRVHDNGRNLQRGVFAQVKGQAH